VIFRPESSLLYFNAGNVRDVVWDRIQAASDLRLVICDLSDAPMVDVAGADMLSKLHADLAKRDVRLRLVEAHAKVRDLLRAAGLDEQVGYFGRHTPVEQAVAEFDANETG
jgi:MFS superfamily sulfate permease-like transporter